MRKIHVKEKKGTESETIIFVHGNSSSSNIFDKIFDLSEMPYNLLSFDLSGHGLSEKSGDYTVDSLKEDIHQVLNKVQGEIILIGHSLGGHLIIEIAQELKNLKGLAIFGTPPLKKPVNFGEAFKANPHSNTLFMENPSDEQLSLFLDDVVTNKEVIPLIRKDYLDTDPKIRSAIAAGLATPDTLQDERNIFLSLEIKKFILHGEADSLISLEYLKKMQEDANESFEIFVIPECGHYPTIEQPGVFLKYLNIICNSTFQLTIK